MKRRDFLKVAAGATFAAAVSAPFYSYLIENNNFTTTTFELGWGLGKRLVHISDTHMGSSVYNINTLLDIISELKPDIIIHTGDHISNEKAIETAMQLLDKLSTIAEVYTVWGNHDIWSGLMGGKHINSVNRVDGVTLLINESTYLDGFWICGVNDPYTMSDDIDKALANTDPDSIKILLAHSPQIIDKAKNRVDLVLSGHTHGGQINIPLIGAIWLPLPRKYYKYVQGYFEVDQTLMYVTRGIGTVGLPFRLNCPPEIVVIEA